MSGAKFVEILFGLFALVMFYVNLCLAGVTIKMILEDEFTRQDFPVAVLVHAFAAVLLLLGVWGVYHF